MKSVNPLSIICSMITQEKLINSSPADGLHGYLNNTKLINIESHNPRGSRRLVIGGIDFPLADTFALLAVFFPSIAWKTCPSRGDDKTVSVRWSG